MDETSASLLDRLAAGPSDADWRRLYDLYAPLLRGWAARAGVPAADADDLVQEVMLAVHRDVGRFDRRGPGAFRAWLWRVLANRLREHARRRPADPATPARLAELEDADGRLSRLWDREHDAHVARQLLARAESDFAPATWAAFRRQVLDGEPAAAVAAELGLSVNAVLIAKSRVLRRLRAEAGGLLG
jgi:RNA polymerase sigma-70 factor (ECF subfamily)